MVVEEDVPHDLCKGQSALDTDSGKDGDHSRYVIWQEGPITAVLETITRPWLRDSPGCADTLGPAVAGTGIKSR